MRFTPTPARHAPCATSVPHAAQHVRQNLIIMGGTAPIRALETAQNVWRRGLGNMTRGKACIVHLIV